MKRINPETGEIFKCGDMREEDPKGKGRYIFKGYHPRKSKDGFNYEIWETPNIFYKRKSQRGAVSKAHVATPKGRAKRMINNSKRSAKDRNIVFDLTVDDILPAVEGGVCELTGLPFRFESHPTKNSNPYAPSIDRIDSEKGYYKDNIRIVLWAVNSAVGESSDEEILPIIKAMVKAIEKNVKQKSTTPVPAGTYPKSEEHTKHGIIPSPGAWEDNYDANHHRGAVYGKDSDNRAQEGSGDSVAHRNKKVEPLEGFTRLEDNGDTEPEIVRLDFGGRRLFD